jgi:hypothetical protein
MQALRQARFLARLVLAWFALSLGVAIASPLVNPQSMELVCASGGAMKLIVKNADGGEPGEQARGHTLDCPLCASVALLPPVISVASDQPSAQVQTQPADPDAIIVARAAAPLPPRGPPSIS